MQYLQGPKMLQKRAAATDIETNDQTSDRPLIGLVTARLIDLIMPPVCLSCREPIATRNAHCPQCCGAIDFISAPRCDHLGIALSYTTGTIMVSAAAAARSRPSARARAVGHYRGTLQRLVHSFKFRDRHDVGQHIGHWLYRSGRNLIAEADVPVPLSRLRLLHRRFNQAAILAQEISRRSGVPAAEHCCGPAPQMWMCLPLPWCPDHET